MMYPDNTPPYADPERPNPKACKELGVDTTGSQTSISVATSAITSQLPRNLTQGIVNSDGQLKRIQQDLLVLTSFIDNSTIHWRPSWFPQEPFSSRFWTLQNPPNVISEYLPSRPHGAQVMTRRMRQNDDPPPPYIKDWDHWMRYCEMYGIPADFLCEAQVELMRLGLPSFPDGTLCAPPLFPLYPEPQPLGNGRYLLDTRTYRTHLPKRFHCVDTVHHGEVVVVHSDGTLQVEKRFDYYVRRSPWSHFSGEGKCIQDEWDGSGASVPRDQGPGRRWSYIPWTEEQALSCRPLTLRLKLGGMRVEGKES